MLDISQLSIEYGATRAVSGVDLSLGPGEVVCLLGANGAGKTSVLRAISNLVAFSGEIAFDGASTAGTTTGELARRGLIHVPEGRHVFPTLTVRENLQMGAVARAGRPILYSIDDVLSLFPALAPLMSRQGFALSGGEQQMVALGRALVAAPRVLLLDEPSLGLAPVVVAKVYEALREIGRDTAMLLVEQNTGDAIDLAGRGYVLAGGRVVLAGSGAELSDRTVVLAGYLGQSDIGVSGPSHDTVSDPTNDKE